MVLPPGCVRVRDLTPPLDPSLFPEVDETRYAIRKVKLVGIKGKNAGREYPLAVLEAALPLYEGAAVNMGHLRPGESRNPDQRMGWVTKPFIRPDGIYADVVLNPENSFAKELWWWAKNNPRGTGFSQDAYVRKNKLTPGKEIVEQIFAVFGIDWVADPSTTSGLTEAFVMEENAIAPEIIAEEPGEPGYEEHIGRLITAIMVDKKLSSADKKKKVLAALKLLDDDKAEPAEKKGTETEETESLNNKSLIEAIQNGFAGMRGDLAKVTESLTKGSIKPVTSVSREPADPIKAVTTGKKEAPSVKELFEQAKTKGSW